MWNLVHVLVMVKTSFDGFLRRKMLIRGLKVLIDWEDVCKFNFGRNQDIHIDLHSWDVEVLIGPMEVNVRAFQGCQHAKHPYLELSFDSTEWQVSFDRLETISLHNFDHGLSSDVPQCSKIRSFLLIRKLCCWY